MSKYMKIVLPPTMCVWVNPLVESPFGSKTFPYQIVAGVHPMDWAQTLMKDLSRYKPRLEPATEAEHEQYASAVANDHPSEGELAGAVFLKEDAPDFSNLPDHVRQKCLEAAKGDPVEAAAVFGAFICDALENSSDRWTCVPFGDHVVYLLLGPPKRSLIQILGDLINISLFKSA